MRIINAFQAMVLALLMSLLGIAFAAGKPATQADFNELQKQVQNIDKDLAVLKETKAGLEKRQNEITAVQANSLAAIANQTTAVGNYISNTSIAITVLVLIAGLISYFNAANKAKEEARKASRIWFDENAIELKKQINELKAEAELASESIKANKTKVESDTHSFNVTYQQAADVLSKTTKIGIGAAPDEGAGRAATPVSIANESLKAKPETALTAEDRFVRGLANFERKIYSAALLAFEKSLAELGKDASNPQKAQYLFAKAVTLEMLDKPEQAIAVYDDIDQRFGKDTAPGVREQVASALVNKGVTLGQLGKPEQEIAVYDDIDQRFGKDTAPGVREQVASALFNKGFRLGQLGKPEEAIAVYDDIDQRFGNDTAPGVREKVAKGLVNKGNALIKLRKFEDALAVYDDIDQCFGKDTELGVLDTVAAGLIGKATTLVDMGKPESGVTVFDEIDRRFANHTAPNIREKVARGLANKGVVLRQIGQFNSAISVFDDIDRRFGRDDLPTIRAVVARGLRNKAASLGELLAPDQEMAFYDEIDKRFGNDTDRAVREEVAGALNGKSYNQLMQAKEDWPNHDFRKQSLESAELGLHRAQLQCAHEDRAMILGNLGYAQFLLDKLDVATVSTTECLNLGGQEILNAQLADAKLHRVEPQDTEYEKMLAEVWKTVQAESPNDKKKL